jgi:adenylate kinase family enzyme
MTAWPSGLTVAILGLPKSGKTTLAESLSKLHGASVLHTDDYKHLPWKDAPDAILARYTADGPDIIEGITVARMFRRGLRPKAVVYIAGGPPMPQMAGLIKRGLTEIDHSVPLLQIGERPSVAYVFEWLCKHA